MLFSKLFDDMSPLDEYKSKELFPLTCPQCGNSFSRRVSQVKHNITHHRCNDMYCSRKCEGMGNNQNSDLSYTFECAHCHTPRTRTPRKDEGKNRFCDKSCAAIYNNRNKIKKGKQPKKSKPKPPIVTYRTCACCGIVEKRTGKGRFISDVCKLCSASTSYKRACAFEFDLNAYPNEFDLSLLSQYGMFHPVRNQSGVSRDHMFSISEGKLNKIPSTILKHPANCKLMLQSENKAKGGNSSITYEELLIRIDEWEKKYGGE